MDPTGNDWLDGFSDLDIDFGADRAWDFAADPEDGEPAGHSFGRAGYEASAADEPIPARGGRPARADGQTARHATQGPGHARGGKPAGGKPDVRDIIDGLLADPRVGKGADGGVLVKTGSQMAGYLPERYHEMRAISRWEAGRDGGPGRWLSEAELFYRQAAFMADFEDDCPYTGTFKSYFPTYNAMSDRQLRGYFTWRARVRRGDVQETSTSFALVYLYELINQVGVADPLDAHRKLMAFARAYSAFAPEIGRCARTWCQDLVVYHGLDPGLLAGSDTVAFDRALATLRAAEAEAPARTPARKRGGGAKGASALPLPPNEQAEERMFQAIDELSTYRLSKSSMLDGHGDALRHIACAVFMRMSARHRGKGKSLLESWFGEEVCLPYTMFGSAVFFETARHADADFELDGIHRYRCRGGLWTCERVHAGQTRNPKLGAAMRAADRLLREAYGFEPPLADDGKTPKYLQQLIAREVEAWMAWERQREARRVDIDLSKLEGIRSTAAQTRESLLIDEERGGDGALLDAAAAAAPPTAPAEPAPATAAAPPAPSAEAHSEPVGPAAASPAAAPPGFPLSPVQAAYLAALVSGDGAGCAAALREAGVSQDMLVDAVNEALFDLVGDTVIECGPDGPALIEDYREDVEGILNHG